MSQAVLTPASRRGPASTLPSSTRSVTPSDSGSLASVSRAVLLLEALHLAEGPLGVSVLARLTLMPKSTAFRLLSHLEQCGLVDRAGRDYQLGRKLFELGNHVDLCRPRGLREVASPQLTELHAATGLTAHLAILDGVDVVYVAKAHGRGAAPVPTKVGGRQPAACTALGKALLAHSGSEAVRRVAERGLVVRTRYSIRHPGVLVAQLADVRERGVAFDREENQVGIECLAAPIFVEGRLTAAVSLTAPITRTGIAGHTSALVRTARTIGSRLTPALAE